MFEMTVNEAINIQTAQLVHYRRLIGRKGVKKIRKQTSMPNVNPDVPIPVRVVNAHIPRGGDIEFLICKKPDYSEFRYNGFDWHNAIRAGKIYSS